MQSEAGVSASIQQRREKQQRVKKKISQILTSVRQQKQHIENHLAINDLKIKKYCEEYEELRYQHDFTQLSQQQTIILSSLIDGLLESGVNPTAILGNQVSEIVKLCKQRQQGNQKKQGEQKIERTDILRIQNEIIKSLMKQIESSQGRKAERQGSEHKL